MPGLRPITSAALPMKARVILHRRRAALERIRDLHVRAPIGNAHRCTECGFPHPCRTRELADAGRTPFETAARITPGVRAASLPAGAGELGSAPGAGGTA